MFWQAQHKVDLLEKSLLQLQKDVDEGLKSKSVSEKELTRQIVSFDDVGVLPELQHVKHYSCMNKNFK